MPVIDLGKVVGNPGASMRFRGEWNGGSEYFNNESYIDTVTHHGSLWVCKQTNTGQEPIEGDYWGIGAQGNSDLNASDVTYDNKSSGLSSNTAQGAIDEIVEIEKVVNGNQADLYSPDETYTAGRLVINNNALWKAKQDINVAEPWTPDHWEPTTLAAELSAVNSSKQNIIIRNISGDLNDFLSLAFGYTASNVTNRPPGTDNGYVEVLPAVEGTLCLQRYTVYNSLIQYERWYLSGEWGEWLKTRG